jgi:hypothetical protein
VIEVAFWPEYGSGPLWIGGSSVVPATLVDDELAGRLLRWNDAYADKKLPMDGGGDATWLAEGKVLLASVRQQLAETHYVVVTEPRWE